MDKKNIENNEEKESFILITPEKDGSSNQNESKTFDIDKQYNDYFKKNNLNQQNDTESNNSKKSNKRKDNKNDVLILGFNNYTRGQVAIIFGIGLAIPYIIQLIFSLIISFARVDIDIRLTGIMNFVIFLINVLLIVPLCFFVNKKAFKEMFLNKQTKILKIILTGVLGYFCFTLLISLYSICANFAFYALYGKDLGSNNNQNSIEMMMELMPVLIFFTTVIFAPIYEEILYRFALTRLCYFKNIYLAFFISSFVFASMHVDFSVFFSGNGESAIVELLNFPTYLIMGIGLSTSYAYSKNIYGSMLLHLINNLTSFILLMLPKSTQNLSSLVQMYGLIENILLHNTNVLTMNLNCFNFINIDMIKLVLFKGV